MGFKSEEAFIRTPPCEVRHMCAVGICMCTGYCSNMCTVGVLQGGVPVCDCQRPLTASGLILDASRTIKGTPTLCRQSVDSVGQPRHAHAVVRQVEWSGGAGA